MNKQDSGALVGYFTLILVLTVNCGFYPSSNTCFCKELKKVDQDSLPENLNNHSPIWNTSNYFSIMTASATTSLVSPSPSIEFDE